MILVLEGELSTELRDGRQFRLTAGMSYHVADEAEPHRITRRQSPFSRSSTSKNPGCPATTAQ